MRTVAGASCALLLAALTANRPLGAAAGSCEDLSQLSLANATVTLAQTVASGSFTPPAADTTTASLRPLTGLTTFCRVAATLRPSPDSEIAIEVWMPASASGSASGWNGKFEAVGNGAFNGTIEYAAMAAALGRGYATSSTDLGHSGNNGRFAIGHPEKVIDFGWRADHEMTVAAKAIISSFYAAAPAHSYWDGCSAGGRQGLKEAQRFPADFDGIVAGSPGLDWTGRAAQAVRVAQRLQPNEAARLSPAKARLLHTAALNACDALDGIHDGVIDDPRRCVFDPGVLQCAGAAGTDGPSCLTEAQVSTARMLYAPQVNAKTQREITALYPGSELGWTDLGWTASARATGLDEFRFLVFKDPQWTIDAFHFDADLVRAEDTDNDTINALDPNLAPFIARGGKLIQYHGWSDPQISPGNSAQYYERVLAAVGDAARVQASYRLFMAPGMGHCRGGDGPNSFDILGALEHWVEDGRAPDRVLAAHLTNAVVDRTRPLCPYPQVARYTGSGSTNDAANFACGTAK